MMGTNASYDVERVGVFTPKLAPVDELGPGEIGAITASIKPEGPLSWFQRNGVLDELCQV